MNGSASFTATATISVPLEALPDLRGVAVRITIRRWRAKVQISVKLIGGKGLAVRAEILEDTLPLLAEVVKKLVDGEPGIDEGQ